VALVSVVLINRRNQLWAPLQALAANTAEGLP
jgi:hypothetical protein